MSQRTHAPTPIIQRGGSYRESSGPSRKHRLSALRSVSLKQVGAFVIVALFTSSLAFVLTSIPSKTTAFNLRAPIFIMSDTEFTAENGVVAGSGTVNDPYVIAGWEISISDGNGIFITGTTAHFVISECHINGTANQPGVVTCVGFNGVSNGTVKQCTFNATRCAVSVVSCSDCVIQENDILGCNGWAMTIEYSSRVNVVNNYFLSANGILGLFWLESGALLNEFLWNEVCISINECDYLTMQENLADSCGKFVSAGGCDYLNICCNRIIAGTLGGIELSTVMQTEIRGNVIDGNGGTAIYASGSNTLMIRDNLINGSQVGGFVMINVDSSVIMGNVISNNYIGYGYSGGITYFTCNNMLVYHNNFLDNTPTQVEDDRGAENRWNTSYPEGGNYWSDYIGIDIMNGPGQNLSGSDGIGDTPYAIDGDSLDFYPLMGPIDFNPGPVAVPAGVPLPTNISTDVTFDGSGSYHPSAPRRTISEYRWDFDCNGVFDTGWSTDPTYTYRFQKPGNCTVILEIMDSEGLTDMKTLETIVYLDEIPIPELTTIVLPVTAMLAIVALSHKRRSGNKGK